MANDRLYLRSSSGRKILIAKHSGGYWFVYYEDLADKLQEFFVQDFVDNDGRGLYWLETEFCDVAPEYNYSDDWFYTAIKSLSEGYSKVIEKVD